MVYCGLYSPPLSPEPLDPPESIVACSSFKNSHWFYMQTNGFWMQINNKTNQCSCMLRNRLTETRAAFCWYSLLIKTQNQSPQLNLYCDIFTTVSHRNIVARFDWQDASRVASDTMFCSGSAFDLKTVRADKGVKSLSMFGNVHIKSSFITLRDLSLIYDSFESAAATNNLQTHVTNYGSFEGTHVTRSVFEVKNTKALHLIIQVGFWM